MSVLFRVPDVSCIHADTFKYFLAPPRVAHAWAALEELGQVLTDPVTRIRTIDTRELLLRAGPTGTPVTVIRKRTCAPEHVAHLHALLGYLAEGPSC